VNLVCDEEAIVQTATAPSLWPEYGWFREFRNTLTLPAMPDAPPPTGMEALEPAAMRGPVRAPLPREMRAGTIVTVACTVSNDGPVSFESVGKHPVFVCYRWYDADGAPAEVGRALHTPLPEALAPGTTVAFSMRIATPQFAGRYRLRVALLQSEVAWFDDVEPSNGIEATVDVAAKSTAVASSLSNGSAP
jgi:hypothetical protein